MKQNPHDIGVNSYSQNNEYYTPKWVWEKVYDVLQIGIKTCWEPFFGREETLKDMRDAFQDVNVICEAGKDFYNGSDNPEENDYDCIITNPPFGGKNKLFRRLKFLGNPFIVLLPGNCIAKDFITRNFKPQDTQYIPIGDIKFLDKNLKEMPKASLLSFVFVCWKMNIDETLLEKQSKGYQLNELEAFCKKNKIAYYGLLKI